MNKYLFFDIDGTLVHSGGAGKIALTKAFQQLFDEPQFTDIRINGCTDRGIAKQIFESHGIEDSQVNWHRFRAEYLEQLPDTLNERQGNVLTGVIELLDELLRHDHLQLGVLTGNTRRGAELKLAHFGLDGYFSFGAFGDNHVERDDVARSALAELRMLHGNVDPSNVWIIGDTPNDIRCGRAIDAMVLAVATGTFSLAELAEYEPDFLMEDLCAANRWLEQLGVSR
jgi:phosphoglycolate phosphatase-like HAD superfamily hydrolase